MARDTISYTNAGEIPPPPCESLPEIAPWNARRIVLRDFSKNQCKLPFVFLRLKDFGFRINAARNLDDLLFVILGDLAAQIHRSNPLGGVWQNFIALRLVPR
jgi:hypothetical protein